jgi:hypothetical protein
VLDVSVWPRGQWRAVADRHRLPCPKHRQPLQSCLSVLLGSPLT